jgi:hypothetical protein
VGKGKQCTVLYYTGKNWVMQGIMGKTDVKSGVGILQSSCIDIKTDCVNVNWVVVVSAGGYVLCSLCTLHSHVLCIKKIFM